jgi:hypothetical protein
MSESLEELKIKLHDIEKFSQSWTGNLFDKIFPGYFNKRIQSLQYQIDYKFKN